MIVGYARTSTIEQIAGLEAQLKELRSVGCDKIYQEQISSIAKRCQLKAAMDFVREGDILVVAKLDRLARSVADLLTIVQSLGKKNVSLRILNLGIDTNTPTGKLMLTMLGAIGQFEREIMLERQREGIAKAKAEGKFKGRKPLDPEIIKEVLRLCETRITRKEVASRLEIGEATVYRVLKEAKLVVAVQ
jgi:DNA invertase Pin-like site-specific DNA recombinase